MKQHAKITHFFTKSLPQKHSEVEAGPSRRVLSPPPLRSSLHSSEPSQSTTPIALDTLPSQPEPSDLPTILQSLKTAVLQLPITVPLATLEDQLARFSGDPVAESVEFDDPWEMADKALNSVIGYGASIEEIATMIRRGKYGMDGMYKWIETCIRELHIDVGLLEGKITRLLDAMKLRCPGIQVCDNIEEISSSALMPPEIEEIPSFQVPHTGSRSVSPIAFSSNPNAITKSSKKFKKSSRCPGYHLIFPDGCSPYGSYPFAMHLNQRFPWSIFITEESLVLRSNDCTEEARVRETSCLPCVFCSSLHDNSTIMGIRHRTLAGAHENTPWAYLSMTQIFGALDRKNKQIDDLRLRALNVGRSLVVRDRNLEAWKRLAMAIASQDIPRLRTLMATDIRSGKSVFSILDSLDQVIRRVYHPRGYEEADYHRAFLIWKLGGSSAANIAHRTLGVPSIDTAKRHVGVTPLCSSPGTPTLEEMSANLAVCYPGTLPRDIDDDVIIGMTMPIDEIKIQERLRWDPRTNMILGVCREHGSKCPLEFRTVAQADSVLACLKSKDIHMASEATVIASCILTGDSKDYSAMPFVVSGTCKRETVSSQESLLRMSSNALRTSQERFGRRLYCIASDGDSRRRRALGAITFTHDLPTSSPIFKILSLLRLFNYKCGDDDATADFDWKHVYKRFRNTLLRQKGITIDNTTITTSVLKHHLVMDGMPASTADAILAPNDKQDVVLMIRLLNALAGLSPASPDASPGFQASRRILRLLGALYRGLLEAYMDVNLSLGEQLVRLSAAAHIILALYSSNKGNFIPVQLYFDVMCMIKNVYFCVAKAQWDNPMGSFWIILLGTDGLEKVFGKMRTMVGSDSHADQLQLANRIDGAVQCVKILETHPDWGGQSRRLNVKSLQQQGSDISKNLDHLNPMSWKGDVSLRNPVLLTCWRDGRKSAEDTLRDAELSSPFENMEEVGGYDILCPFGHNQMALLNGTLTSEEVEETEEEQDGGPSNLVGNSESSHCTTQVIDVPTTTHSDGEHPAPEDIVPDLDDMAGTASLGDAPPKYEAWITVDDSSSKHCHKSTILRLYSNPLAVSNSKDRLRNVRGYSQYQEVATETSLGISFEDEGSSMVSIEDPALTLVSCANQTFLALIQILDIHLDSARVQKIPERLVHEPNVRIHGKVMKLSMIDMSHQPEGPDWEWTGTLEACPPLEDLPGRYIELINPTIQRPTGSMSASITQTFAFRTSDLRAMGAILFERLKNEIHSFRVLSPTETFPYRSETGSACFVCEKETTGPTRHEKCCKYCPYIDVSRLSGPELIKHSGGHSLHDPRLKDMDNPCGFCLSVGLTCSIRLIKRGKVHQIDLAKSRCPYLRKISLSKTGKFSPRSPCTNIPMKCPLCDNHADAIWKYNFSAHFLAIHPTADKSLYQVVFALHPDEITLMKAVFLSKPRITKKKKSSQVQLQISEGHSTRIALRSVESEDVSLTYSDLENNLDSGSGSSDEDSGSDDEKRSYNEDNIDSALNEERGLGYEFSNTRMGAPSLNADPDSLEPVAAADSNSAEISTSARVRQGVLRKRTNRGTDLQSDTAAVCADCENAIFSDRFVSCESPGCDLTYHTECRGLLERPLAGEGWFCDDECRGNAGYRVTGRKKRRRE